jgi:hypothetical protein
MKFTTFLHRPLPILFLGIVSFAACPLSAQQAPDVVHQPFLLDTGLVSRSISFENPTGKPGEGGKAASPLGVGRKGSAYREVKPGETVPLCDLDGPGTIRHIWLTVENRPENMRGVVLRAYWEGQEHPSIECPVGDFFGNAQGKIVTYGSAVHSSSSSGGMNIWLPMPFVKHARFTVTNETPKKTFLFYQMDLTLGDKLPADVGRLHVLFRRENPTVEKKDFEILPLRKNKGRYVGAVIGVRNLHPKQWWGEGEIKVYMDGDTQFPTICGTGSEDYVGLAWGLQQATFLYNGCSLREKGLVSMYRWHLLDPYAWRKEARITIQQLTWVEGTGPVDTADDWSCATFWYEPTPSAPLPPPPDVKARTAEIWKE